MRVVHVLRKPLGEGATVAVNVLKHGCGGINIDRTRITLTDGASLGRNNKPGPNGWKNSSGGPNAAMSDPVAASGRWPANLILEHREGCGSDPDGMGTWNCSEGCPIPDLDAQSGISKSTGGRAYQNTNVMYEGGWSRDSGISADPGFGDTGGASRFFKQVQSRGHGK